MDAKKTISFISLEVKNKLRSRSFAWLLFIAIFIPFFIFPNEHFLINALIIEPEIYLQFSHSSWCSMATAFCATLLFIIFCTIYSKDLIHHDKNKYPIIFISKMNRISYILGKYIANILLILIVFAFLIIGTLFVSLTNFPLSEISLYSFFSPFIVLIPSCFFVVAVTALVDIVFNNKNVSILGSIVLMLLLLFVTFPGTPLGEKWDISGAAKIRESIEMAEIHLTGNILKQIMVLGGVSADKMTGDKILILNGLYDFKSAVSDGWLIILVSFTIILIASLIFLIKNKNFNFYSVKNKAKKHNSNKGTLLFLLLKGRSIFINLIIIRLYTQIKENKGVLLLFFIINMLGCILIDFVLFQLIILPMSFMLFIKLLSSIGVQEHKNNFLTTFSNISNINLLLPSGAFSASIIMIIACTPSLVKMILLGQLTSAMTAICLIAFL